ncbi:MULTISPECIES: hypothetical protein [Ralstonia]|jgi:hypothetical protein|uniref:hypothetical protein n=1 Tax=Ralstonia TaxID=48736 RepID=UPI0018EE39C7|nr:MULTISPECIES: hypothetical protein [unclassified Ralstonia]
MNAALLSFYFQIHFSKINPDFGKKAFLSFPLNICGHTRTALPIGDRPAFLPE